MTNDFVAFLRSGPEDLSAIEVILLLYYKGVAAVDVSSKRLTKFLHRISQK